MAQLEAHEVPLRKVFGSDYDFQIPAYQRPYSWGPDQATQLFEDLADAVQGASDEPYFLGSVVLVKVPGETTSDVIDGQQRLTTLTILLAVLRDGTTNTALADELTTMLLEPGSQVLGRSSKPRLTLRDRDSGFFQKHVQERGTISSLLALNSTGLDTDSQRSILLIAKSFSDLLSTWNESRKLDLVQLIGQRTFLVVVTTPNLDSAYRIFSVMNDRGMNLSEPDIFKSKIIGLLPEFESKAYADKWEDAEASLGKSDFRDLFLHIRLIFSKDRAKTTLLKEFPQHVLAKYLPQSPRSFVDDVVTPYSEAFEQMRDHNYSAPVGADDVNQWFRRLDRLGDNDWRPVALWAMVNHGDDSAWLNAFLRKLERLGASMLIRRLYTTPRVLRYAELLRDLDNSLGLDSPRFDLSSGEKTETIEGLSGDVYKHTKGRRYIMLRLDETLAQNQGVQYNHRLITVEHVLPQNPPVKSQWNRDFKPSDREVWTHKLANLVLLNQAKNSQAGNLDFDEKKRRYFASKQGVTTFAVTSQVLGSKSWTPDTLRSRQAAVLAALTSEWNLA
ncbi:DUF262 domain-containing protein [Actinomycetes bacterium M1A6_2h]